MSTSLLLWLIVALPLAACLVIGLGIRHSKRLSGYLSILAVAVSAVLSLSALNTVLGPPAPTRCRIASPSPCFQWPAPHSSWVFFSTPSRQ